MEATAIKYRMGWLERKGSSIVCKVLQTLVFEKLCISHLCIVKQKQKQNPHIPFGKTPQLYVIRVS